MTRRAVLFAALVPVGAVPAAAVSHGDGHHRTVVDGHQVRFDGLGPERWAQRWRREHRMVLRLRRRLQSARAVTAPVSLGPAAAIRYVFGVYADQALRVAGCESGLSIYAHNGQYHGLFQMGEHERALYGDAADAVGQAQAAYRYFVASGRDWSPWSCKP